MSNICKLSDRQAGAHSQVAGFSISVSFIWLGLGIVLGKTLGIMSFLGISVFIVGIIVGTFRIILSLMVVFAGIEDIIMVILGRSCL